jgi:hypothetical protein
MQIMNKNMRDNEFLLSHPEDGQKDIYLEFKNYVVHINESFLGMMNFYDHRGEHGGEGS